MYLSIWSGFTEILRIGKSPFFTTAVKSRYPVGNGRAYALIPFGAFWFDRYLLFLNHR
jgi:hypothetical protein